MATATNKKRKDYTQIPNAVTFDKTLSLSEFRTFAAILSYAYGDKTEAYPSQVTLKERLGMHRETVGLALKRLVGLGLIKRLRKTKDGQWVYKVRGLDHVGKSDTQGDGKSDIAPVGKSGTKQTKQKKTSKKEASPRSAGASPSGAEATSGESVHGHGYGTADSAASPESAVPSIGQRAELATPAGHNGRNTLLSRDDDAQDEFGFGPRSESEPSSDSAPRDDADAILDEVFGKGSDHTPQKSAERPYSKRAINELMLSPEGVPLDDDRDELFYEVEAVTLPSVYGEPFNPGDLDKLITDRGVAFCRMWAHWLPRKIADKYAKDSVKGVPSPTGLYTQAVREGWKVDPAWPQFDETLHTVAAREACRKREEARELKHSLRTTGTVQ